jgi:DNA recombination protein RmuC
MAPYCDFAEQSVASGEGGRQRPDLTVNLPNGAFIVVDSKVPLSAYLEMQDAANEAERQRLLVEHGKAMRAHVKALAEKRYWEQFPESPDFVVMFVPGESFLADALRVDASLAEDAMRSRVVVTSPMSLMALLLTVARGWQTRQIAENATKVQSEAAELYRRIDTVLESMAKTGRGLTTATDAYNKMIGSVEARLLPSMRRFREFGVPGDDLVDVPQLEHSVREIGAEELGGGELGPGAAGELEA